MVSLARPPCRFLHLLLTVLLLPEDLVLGTGFARAAVPVHPLEASSSPRRARFSGASGTSNSKNSRNASRSPETHDHRWTTNVSANATKGTTTNYRRVVRRRIPAAISLPIASRNGGGGGGSAPVVGAGRRVAPPVLGAGTSGGSQDATSEVEGLAHHDVEDLLPAFRRGRTVQGLLEVLNEDPFAALDPGRDGWSPLHAIAHDTRLDAWTVLDYGKERKFLQQEDRACAKTSRPTTPLDAAALSEHNKSHGKSMKGGLLLRSGNVWREHCVDAGGAEDEVASKHPEDPGWVCSDDNAEEIIEEFLRLHLLADRDGTCGKAEEVEKQPNYNKPKKAWALPSHQCPSSLTQGIESVLSDRGRPPRPPPPPPPPPPTPIDVDLVLGVDPSVAPVEVDPSQPPVWGDEQQAGGSCGSSRNRSNVGSVESRRRSRSKNTRILARSLSSDSSRMSTTTGGARTAYTRSTCRKVSAGNSRSRLTLDTEDMLSEELEGVERTPGSNTTSFRAHPLRLSDVAFDPGEPASEEESEGDDTTSSVHLELEAAKTNEMPRNNRKRPLEIASKATTLAQILVEHGADVNAAITAPLLQGTKPLFGAWLRINGEGKRSPPNVDLAAFLLLHGADFKEMLRVVDILDVGGIGRSMLFDNTAENKVISPIQLRRWIARDADYADDLAGRLEQNLAKGDCKNGLFCQMTSQHTLPPEVVLRMRKAREVRRRILAATSSTSTSSSASGGDQDGANTIGGKKMQPIVDNLGLFAVLKENLERELRSAKTNAILKRAYQSEVKTVMMLRLVEVLQTVNQLALEAEVGMGMGVKERDGGVVDHFSGKEAALAGLAAKTRRGNRHVTV